MTDFERLPASEQLANLTQDVNGILTAFQNILGSNESRRRPSLQEKERLALLRQHLKQPIAGGLTDQAQLVEDSVSHIQPTRSSPLSGTDMAMVVNRLTEKLETISGELVRKVEESATKNREADSKNADMEVRTENYKADIAKLEKRLQKAMEEKNITKAVCDTALKQVDEKNEQIIRLNREKNVQLWQREKARVLKEAIEREAVLVAELEEMRIKVRDQKDRHMDRHQRMTEEVKKEKMRAEFLIRQSCDDDDPIVQMENIQRQLYITEKRLVGACDEIKLQQRVMAGILNGITTDYGIAKGKWRDGQPHTVGDDLGELLAILHQSVCAGTIEVVKADLASSYQGLQKDITGFSPKVLNLMKKITDFSAESLGGEDVRIHIEPIAMKPKPGDSSTDPSLSPRSEALKHSKDVRRLSATGTRKQAHVTAPPIFSVQGAGGRRTSQNGGIPEGREPPATLGRKISTTSAASRRKRAEDNPKLVNPLTGLPNVREAVNLFPELNDAQVRVHFSRFMLYDKNSDFTLDKVEVKAALQEIRDSQINDQDFSLAFEEIDTDGSGSVDFYEYLILNRMLQQNAGKNALVHSAQYCMAVYAWRYRGRSSRCEASCESKSSLQFKVQSVATMITLLDDAVKAKKGTGHRPARGTGRRISVTVKKDSQRKRGSCRRDVPARAPARQILRPHPMSIQSGQVHM